MRLFKKSDQQETRLPEVVVEQPRLNTTLPENATDDSVIDLWLKQHAPLTQQAYARDIKAFRAFLGYKQLQQITLADLQALKDSLDYLAEATAARRISAVKSLLTFCHEAGYTLFNVGAVFKAPKVESNLAARIMSEAQLQRMLALETNPRNHALLRLLYNAGLRVSEICALTWNDVQTRETGAQIHAYGKGEKERYVLISPETYQELLAIKGNALDFAPVFQSRKKTNGGQLTRGQVNKIVEDSAVRAGIATYEERNKQGEMVTRSRVSPHWLRHAHASHALDKGAPVTLVRDTLGYASIATTNKYSHARPGASSGTYLAV